MTENGHFPSQIWETGLILSGLIRFDLDQSVTIRYGEGEEGEQNVILWV